MVTSGHCTMCVQINVVIRFQIWQPLLPYCGCCIPHVEEESVFPLAKLGWFVIGFDQLDVVQVKVYEHL